MHVVAHTLPGLGNLEQEDEQSTNSAAGPGWPTTHIGSLHERISHTHDSMEHVDAPRFPVVVDLRLLFRRVGGAEPSCLHDIPHFFAQELAIITEPGADSKFRLSWTYDHSL